MTAYVSIPVATAANVLKVPNAALRYKPDLPAEEIRALYQKHGIPETAGPRAQGPSAATASAGGARVQAAGNRKGATAGAARDSTASGEEGQLPRYDTQVVWKLSADNSLEPVRIKTGITDHTFTEVVQDLNGELKAGEDLVTGVAQGRASGNAPRPGGPGTPRGR
jgi:HlyD family secretion protein